MLSRDAERVYWLARYVERTEGTARLLNAFSQNMLDLPIGTEMSWDMMLDILSAKQVYFSRYSVVNERNVMKFMIVDLDNGSSISASVRYARENVRTSRDILPIEAWEIWNELYLYVRTNAEKSISRRARYDFLSRVLAYCHQFNGYLENCLSYGLARTFIDMGRYIERADTSSRILDVGSGFLMPRGDEPHPFDPILWMNVLRSVSGLHAYRRVYGSRISAANVARYILTATEFPRSVNFCLQRLSASMATLPNHDTALKTSDHAESALQQIELEHEFDASALHQLIDEMQRELIDVHNQICQTWFPQ